MDDLKSCKYAGLDNIPAKHLKNASNVLNVLLSILCMAMIKHGYIANNILETVIITVIQGGEGGEGGRGGEGRGREGREGGGGEGGREVGREGVREG